MSLPLGHDVSSCTAFRVAYFAALHKKRLRDECDCGKTVLLQCSMHCRNVHWSQSMKTMQDLVSFSQANFAAFTESSRILAAGVQDLSKRAVAVSQAQLASSLAHMQSLSGVTSVERVVELQTRALRETLQTGLTETGRLAEAAIKLAEQAATPVTARAEAALQVFSRAA